MLSDCENCDMNSDILTALPGFLLTEAEFCSLNEQLMLLAGLRRGRVLAVALPVTLNVGRSDKLRSNCWFVSNEFSLTELVFCSERFIF